MSSSGRSRQTQYSGNLSEPHNIPHSSNCHTVPVATHTATQAKPILTCGSPQGSSSCYSSRNLVQSRIVNLNNQSDLSPQQHHDAASTSQASSSIASNMQWDPTGQQTQQYFQTGQHQSQNEYSTGDTFLQVCSNFANSIACTHCYNIM